MFSSRAFLAVAILGCLGFAPATAQRAGSLLTQLLNPGAAVIGGPGATQAACLWNGTSGRFQRQMVDPDSVAFDSGSTWAPEGSARTLDGACRHLLDSACNVVYTFTAPCSDGDPCTRDTCFWIGADPIGRRTCPFPACRFSSPSCRHLPLPCPGQPRPAADASQFSVMAHGATGAGVVDDSQAIVKAFNAACAFAQDKGQRATVLLPAMRFFLVARAMALNGPCGSAGVTLQLSGTLLMALVPYRYGTSFPDYLVSINNVDGLIVSGGGEINGRGALWWDMRQKQMVDHPPHMVRISNSSNVEVGPISMRNAPMAHLHIVGGSNIHVHDLATQAPPNSPNTDSLGVHGSSNVLIENCQLQTGDDNVAITSGSSNVVLRNLLCLAGHGISIGSLGIGGSVGCVSNVWVENITMLGLQNGLRIKTYQGGTGRVSNVTFSNVTMADVSNPIVINQFYCDKHNAGPAGCRVQPQAVAVSGVTFQNIQGTCNGTQGIFLQCSSTVPCQAVTLKDIAIWPAFPVTRLTPLVSAVYGRQKKVASPKLPEFSSFTSLNAAEVAASAQASTTCGG